MENNSINDESTKARIVSEAIKLFSLKGYEKTSVKEIVEAANVSKPVLYYYFKNKDSLFKHILENGIHSLHNSLYKIMESSDENIRDILEKLTQVHLNAAVENTNFIRFLHSIIFSGLYDDICDFHKTAVKFFDDLSNVFSKWQKKNLIRNDISPKILAGSFLALVRGNMMAITYEIIKKDKMPTSHDLVEIFLGGVKK